MLPVEDGREKSPPSEQKAQEAKDEYRFVVEETFRIRAQVVEAILWHEPEKFKPLLRKVQNLRFGKRVLFLTGIHRLFHDNVGRKIAKWT